MSLLQKEIEFVSFHCLRWVVFAIQFILMNEYSIHSDPFSHTYAGKDMKILLCFLNYISLWLPNLKIVGYLKVFLLIIISLKIMSEWIYFLLR